MDFGNGYRRYKDRALVRGGWPGFLWKISLPPMTHVPRAVGGGPTPLAVFDHVRTRALAKVQEPELKRYAVMLLAFGAGLLPLMAGSAKAALAKMPTDGADTLLMLMGSALVLLMTPGLAFFYGGFTRAKNVLNTMMMSFFLMGLIGVVWVVVGYSLAFDTGFGSPFIGGLGQMMLNGVGGELGDAPLADGFNISATSFALFQGMFAIITPALISGALVERINFKAWFWFSLLWSLFVYCPLCHMVWGGGYIGPFGTIGALDFAGGTVVHISAGVAALVSAAIVGPAAPTPTTNAPPTTCPSSFWVRACCGSAGSVSTEPAISPLRAPASPSSPPPHLLLQPC